MKKMFFLSDCSHATRITPYDVKQNNEALVFDPKKIISFRAIYELYSIALRFIPSGGWWKKN